MRLGSWGRAEFGWVHAALELGARGFGWLARGSGAVARGFGGGLAEFGCWMGGTRLRTRLRSWGSAEFAWVELVARMLARVGAG